LRVKNWLVVEKRDLLINIKGLYNKDYEYKVAFDDDLFKGYESRILEKGKGQIFIKLVKSTTMIQLMLIIDGTIELICDRSLKPFDFDINLEEEVIFKFGEEYKEIDDKLTIIPHETEVLDLNNVVYDIINLSVPMKKIHPDHYSESEEDELIYATNNNDENHNDPRWRILKSINNSNN